ncbi:MAG TPA: cardiolipin synthase ClsB [Rubrivivax sp.]|nr:cardiolipin synthase ClsB [Rubrivivax sp.]
MNLPAPLADTRDAAPQAQVYSGGNRVRLLQGGDELFPAMQQAMAAARSEVWLVTYIFHDDEAGAGIAEALRAAARRGVAVHVLVDGFGSRGSLSRLRAWFADDGLSFDVFRPLQRWSAWLQPAQLRRLHHKLCVVDDAVAFVGGINILDDRNDLMHGRSGQPRLDFAVELRGPVVPQVRHLAQALDMRARLGHDWRSEVGALARSRSPVADTLQLLRELRSTAPPRAAGMPDPVHVAFVVRDNLGQRRAIESSYIEAVRGARHRVDIACPYFYPRRAFRRSLQSAAQRGVQVRLLMQGKVDYRMAALAARVLYDELMSHGVHIFEYTPAFLHAKVAVVDERWATVGSSNIDPLSLLLNLEANAVVRDAAFAAELRQRLDAAFAVSHEVRAPPLRDGWRSRLARRFVAWCAQAYLRVAGITSRY